jgi:acyl carrier protein
LPAAQRSSVLAAHLRRLVAATLGADESAIHAQTPLASLGVDSLMAFELKVKIDRELDVVLPPERLAAGANVAQLADQLLALCGLAEAPAAEVHASARAARAWQVPASDEQFLRIVPQADAAELEALPLDGVALTYLPDKLRSVGGLGDDELQALFGGAPLVTNYFETAFGRIGCVTLPVRSHALLNDARGKRLVQAGLALAARRGARCVSLTGLIPSATDYGLSIERHPDDRAVALTTGHATTTAAVVTTLRSMLQRAHRGLAQQRLAALGIGSIGQSCVRLMLHVLPHPAQIVLCDLFARADALAAFADELRTQHGFHGALRIAHAQSGVPDDVYEADAIVAAVSAASVLDVERLRPGTLVVDDSYPPAFDLARAARRIEERADVLFSNAGMLRLATPVRETFVVPSAAEPTIERFGLAAFRDEVVRDPCEITACVLSSVLTGSGEDFPATLGIAPTDDLVRHYRGLERVGLAPARLQCENYFVPDACVDRFVARDAALPARAAAD